MTRPSSHPRLPDHETSTSEAGWRFLDTPALMNALAHLPPFGMVRMTSAPSEEEKAMTRVMDALGRLVRQGARPPLARNHSPQDARRLSGAFDGLGAVLIRPDDGMAVLINYPMDDGETQEQLVQRCLRDETGSASGLLYIGRLAPDGQPIAPWAPMNTHRLTGWTGSSGADHDLREALADLAARTRRGGLRPAYHAWEQALLRAAVDSNTAPVRPLCGPLCDAGPPGRRSPRRL